MQLRPLPSRLVVGSSPDALDAHELLHLRDLPSPANWKQGDWETWKAELW